MRNLQNLSSEWYFCIFKNNHFVVMYFKVDICFWFFKFCIFYANFVGYANYTKWQIRNLYKSWIRYFLHFPTKFQLWGVFWNCHRCGKSSGAIISLIEWKMKKLRDFEWILHTVLWPLKWKPTESIGHIWLISNVYPTVANSNHISISFHSISVEELVSV